jgi:hypothetical protein
MIGQPVRVLDKANKPSSLLRPASPISGVT